MNFFDFLLGKKKPGVKVNSVVQTSGRPIKRNTRTHARPTIAKQPAKTIVPVPMNPGRKPMARRVKKSVPGTMVATPRKRTITITKPGTPIKRVTVTKPLTPSSKPVVTTIKPASTALRPVFKKSPKKKGKTIAAKVGKGILKVSPTARLARLAFGRKRKAKKKNIAAKPAAIKPINPVIAAPRPVVKKAPKKKGKTAAAKVGKVILKTSFPGATLAKFAFGRKRRKKREKQPALKLVAVKPTTPTPRPAQSVLRPVQPARPAAPRLIPIGKAKPQRNTLKKVIQLKKR